MSKRKVSEAWAELGYDAVQEAKLNAEADQARAADKRAHEKRKAERAAVPVRRADAKSAFAHMHQVVEEAKP